MSTSTPRDLNSGSVFKNLLRFSMPIVLANLLMTLYSIIDTLIVGRYLGSEGISAVTTGSQFFFLLTLIGNGVANGAQIVISQVKGANSNKDLKEIIGTLLTVSTILAAVMTVLGIVLYNPALGMLNTPLEVWDDAGEYMQITSLSMIPLFLATSISAALRGMGDSTRPLIFTALAAVMNVFLDILFVGPLNMGVAGAAWATLFSIILQGGSSVLYLFMKRKSFVFDFKLKSFAIKKRWLKELARMGIPQIIQSSAVQLSMTLVTSLVNSFGVVASATVGVGSKVFNLFNLPSGSIGTAASSMAGQAVGAGKLDRVKECVKSSLILNLAIFAVCAIIMAAIPETLISIFDNDPEVIKLGAQYLRIQILQLFGVSVFCAYNAACIGVGNAILSTCGFLLDAVVTRISLCLLFTYVFGFGLVGLFWATAIAPVSAALVFGIYYHSGKWRTFRSKILEATSKP